MNILHDWDEIPIRVNWARRRGISLIIYCLANKFSFLKRIRWIKLNSRKVELEKMKYMITLYKLDILVNVKPIFGIRDDVKERYNSSIDALISLYDLDVRRHIHIGLQDDPDKERTWIPVLNKNVLPHFDSDYRDGIINNVKANEIAVFHIDYPYQLSDYIDYLFEVMKNG